MPLHECKHLRRKKGNADHSSGARAGTGGTSGHSQRNSDTGASRAAPAAARLDESFAADAAAAVASALKQSSVGAPSFAQRAEAAAAASTRARAVPRAKPVDDSAEVASDAMQVRGSSYAKQLCHAQPE